MGHWGYIHVKLQGAGRLEAAIGHRDRREASDLGLGLQRRDMRHRLSLWGHDAPEQSCREWLQSYRLGDGARNGNVSVTFSALTRPAPMLLR